MKRLSAILLAVVFILAMLTACGDDTDSSSSSSKSDATEKATEEVTEKATEAPTEAPTDAPTEAPTSAPPATQTDFLYTDPSGVYQVEVPVIWNDKGLIIDETTDGNEVVKFVYKDAYYQGAGNVFSIVLVTKKANIVDVTQLPHAKELFNDGEMQVFVNYPTDVQFAPYDQPGSADFNKQQAEYNALSETKDAIIDSFLFRDL